MDKYYKKLNRSQIAREFLRESESTALRKGVYYDQHYFIDHTVNSDDCHDHYKLFTSIEKITFVLKSIHRTYDNSIYNFLSYHYAIGKPSTSNTIK